MPIREVGRKVWIDGYNHIDPVEGRRDIFIQLIMRGDTDCNCESVKHFSSRTYKEFIAELIEFGIELGIIQYIEEVLPERVIYNGNI